MVQRPRRRGRTKWCSDGEHAEPSCGSGDNGSGGGGSSMDANSTAEQLLLLNAYQKLNADLHMNGTVAANGGVNNNNGSSKRNTIPSVLVLASLHEAL